MDLPDYVTVDEVRRVCKQLGIRDWTKLKKAAVQEKEAKILLGEVNVEGMPIDLEDFRIGLEVELEHGTRFKDANVTNNHPVLTAKIVLAHLKETLDYYKLLDVAELEGDMLKAVAAGNGDKALSYYRRLVDAKLALAQSEAKALAPK